MEVAEAPNVRRVGREVEEILGATATDEKSCRNKVETEVW